MRFCDLFISYKIGLKEIINLIPFTKLPLYRKIAVVCTFAFSLLSLLFWLVGCSIIAIIVLLIAMVGMIVFIFIDSRKNNMTYMLVNHFRPYSKQRIEMVIDVLEQYNIDIYNSGRIDMLIIEAERAKLQSDYLAPIKKPIKTLGTIIVPIVVFVAKQIADTAAESDIFIMSLQAIVIIILSFCIILSVSQIIKEFLYRDYNYYNEFISDCNQIKLFYSKN